MNPPKRRPGDQILDRIAPHLTGPERDFARERLEQFAGLLVRIAIRQVREERAAGSRESTAQGKMADMPSSL